METSEIKSFRELCKVISRSGRILAEDDCALKNLLLDRYERAIELIEEKAVKKYIFTPSSRIIWIVKGKKDVYQVIPQSNFCSCDDFYFRVLDKKKQMCYHLVAQGLASALNLYETVDLSDHEYEKISSRLRQKPSA
ncbi:MAG: hypothetical protein L6N95_03710 [Candidatus Methylarchaceae archaeon HK01B]|nr:hypothetical protein [Candidatus Methylarchaceae archaeon HK01B]